MNITHYEVKVSSQETNKMVRLLYYGNENIVIYENKEDEVDKATDKAIVIPRAVLESFVRLINES